MSTPRKIDPREIVTVQQAAAIIGVHKSRIWQYCKDGRLGCKTPIGIVITRSEAEAFRPLPVGRPANPL